MIPGSKKERSVLEASRKVSDAKLLANCNDMYDAQYDEFVVHGSPFRDRNGLNLPKFESRYFDGNPTDYSEFIKEFEIMLGGFLLNDEVKYYYTSSFLLNNLCTLRFGFHIFSFYSQHYPI
ncbi:unnamed protein product [Trichobilharzia regenti]|nr:unnamed protein product [Trichobilharzia regenti]